MKPIISPDEAAEFLGISKDRVMRLARNDEKWEYPSPLDEIMGTEEASERWDLSQDHVKRLCREGKVLCRLFGKTWILDKNQPNPKQKK